MQGPATVSNESVNCLAFRASVARGEPLDSAARQHASGCEACGAAVQDDAAVGRRLLTAASSRRAGDDSATESALRAARLLLARERGLLGGLRARPAWQRRAVLFGSFGAALAFVAGHAAHAPAEVALHVVTFAAASLLLMWPLDRPLPQLRRALAAGGSVALPLAFALWAHARATSPAEESSPLPCLALGAVLAAGLLVVLSALDRRAGLGVRQALLAGATSGLAANALLHLHCPSDAFAHLILGHAPLGALAALAAMALSFARASRRDPAR